MKPTESMTEAAARSLAWPNPPADELAWETLRAEDQTMFLMDAEAALIAVMPLIEAAVLEPFEVLFAGGPDTPCRTTYPDGVECVEVSMADLRAAFNHARTYPEWSAK